MIAGVETISFPKICEIPVSPSPEANYFKIVCNVLHIKERVRTMGARG